MSAILPAAQQSLRLLLITPSHYDEEGYVIQWWWSVVQAQSLPVVSGILHDAIRREVLPGVSLETRVYDEAANVIRPEREIRWLQGATRCALLLVGVQTNHYPRALDLAREFRAAGIPVLIGGFHVSGVLAMLPDWKAGLGEAEALGVTLYAGELECGVDGLLRDLWAEQLKPLYNYLKENADMTKAPMPRIEPRAIRQTWRRLAGVDMGRGCPYLCTFCTIINVHGRRPRQRKAEDVISYVRDCVRHGVRDFFISDDNFARNQNWESILDAFIELREQENVQLDLVFQVDIRASRIPRFIDKAVRAGCFRVFIGVESIRDDNLEATDKRQNKLEELGAMLLAWKRAGVIIYAGYIIGMPHDTPERIAEDVRLLQTHTSIDFPEFTVLTPIPGSADHQQWMREGVPMDEDFNRYDGEHVNMDHPQMSREQWQRLYFQAWDWYYDEEHMARLFKRALAHQVPVQEIFKSFVGFYNAVRYEGVHPLNAGVVRRKVRRQRRPGMPLEPAWRFYPRWLVHTLRVQYHMIVDSARGQWILFKAKRDLARNGYHEPLLESSLAVQDTTRSEPPAVPIQVVSK